MRHWLPAWICHLQAPSHCDDHNTMIFLHHARLHLWLACSESTGLSAHPHLQKRQGSRHLSAWELRGQQGKLLFRLEQALSMQACKHRQSIS